MEKLNDMFVGYYGKELHKLKEIFELHTNYKFIDTFYHLSHEGIDDTGPTSDIHDFYILYKNEKEELLINLYSWYNYFQQEDISKQYIYKCTYSYREFFEKISKYH